MHQVPLERRKLTKKKKSLHSAARCLLSSANIPHSREGPNKANIQCPPNLILAVASQGPRQHLLGWTANGIVRCQRLEVELVMPIALRCAKTLCFLQALYRCHRSKSRFVDVTFLPFLSLSIYDCYSLFNITTCQHFKFPGGITSGHDVCHCHGLPGSHCNPKAATWRKTLPPGLSQPLSQPERLDGWYDRSSLAHLPCLLSL